MPATASAPSMTRRRPTSPPLPFAVPSQVSLIWSLSASWRAGAALLVDQAVAVVVDSVAADLHGPWMHDGVVVVALVAPAIPVAVGVGRRAGHPALTVDERLQVGGAAGDHVTRRPGGLLDLGRGCPGVRIGGRRLGDLLGPRVDPALELIHVPLRQQ